MGTRTMIHDLISIGFAAIALVGGTILSGAASAAELQSAAPAPAESKLEKPAAADTRRVEPTAAERQPSAPAVIAPESGCPQMPLVEPIYLLRMDTLL